MQSSLNLPSLTNRRKIARLSLFHKIYHRSHHLHSLLIVAPVFVSHQLDHAQEFPVLQCKTMKHLNSFVPKSWRECNGHPNNIASVTDSSRFRETIANILSSGQPYPYLWFLMDGDPGLWWNTFVELCLFCCFSVSDDFNTAYMMLFLIMHVWLYLLYLFICII